MKLSRLSMMNTLAIAASSVLLLACSDVPVSPSVKSPGLLGFRFTQGESFNVDVVTDVTLFGPDGKVSKKYKHTATVEVKIVRGLALTKPKKNTIKEAAFRYSALASDPEVVDDSINLTPVVGVANDELSDYYSDQVHDSNGNTLLVVGTSPTANYPVTEVNGYVNGQLAATTQMSWTQVSGGYLLDDQTLTERTPSGGVTSIMHSTVEQSTVQFVSMPSTKEKMLGAISNTARNVACLLLPKVAYAGTAGCFWEGVDLAASVVGIGFASAAGGLVTPGAIAVYLMGWGVYTRTLYVFLKCMRQRT